MSVSLFCSVLCLSLKCTLCTVWNECLGDLTFLVELYFSIMQVSLTIFFLFVQLFEITLAETTTLEMWMFTTMTDLLFLAGFITSIVVGACTFYWWLFNLTMLPAAYLVKIKFDKLHYTRLWKAWYLVVFKLVDCNKNHQLPN